MNLVRMNLLSDLEEITPLESSKYPGFYHTHVAEHIVVSRDGVVLNAKTGRRIVGHVIAEGRGSQIVTFFKEGRTKAIQVHRLIAHTFCGRPSRHKDKPHDALQVNHIDFNRTNNSADNLEWVTAAENIEHYCKSDSRSGFNGVEVEAYNPNTGSVLNFVSMKSCADYFGIRRSTFFKHLKTKTNAKCQGYVFRLTGDDWFFTDYEKAIELSSGLKKSVKVTNVDDKTSVIYDSIATAAKWTGLDKKRIYRSFMKNKPFEQGCYLVTKY